MTSLVDLAQTLDSPDKDSFLKGVKFIVEFYSELVFTGAGDVSLVSKA